MTDRLSIPFIIGTDLTYPDIIFGKYDDGPYGLPVPIVEGEPDAADFVTVEIRNYELWYNTSITFKTYGGCSIFDINEAGRLIIRNSSCAQTFILTDTGDITHTGNLHTEGSTLIDGTLTVAGNILGGDTLTVPHIITNSITVGGIAIGGGGGSGEGAGEQGPAGYTGSIGFTGSQGPAGNDGATGYTGSRGATGATGAQGLTGYTGSQGPAGPSGDSGTSGSQGPIGYTGSQGPAGSGGTAGYTGSQGATGFTGSRGIVGFTGSQGPQGPSGTAGATGTQGPMGYTGSKGAAEEVANVLYVSKSGSDINDGKSLATSFLSIKAALTIATPGTTVFVKSGNYIENNPVAVPPGVAVVGDNLRTVSVRPQHPSSALFYVNNGVYMTGMTFRDHINGAPAVSYNPDGSAGYIYTSPYIQNCSSITTTGKGMYIDGSVVGGLKSMVLDAYTQFNQGGMGIHIVNGGYAQLVSIFTICCDVSVLCETGGQCSITNSNTSFGNYGLKATGVGSQLYTGAINGAGQVGNDIIIDGLTTRPKVNDAVTFDGGTTYYTVASSTPLVSGQSTVTLIETVGTAYADNTIASFHQLSFISASGHTFEYTGAGTDLTTALPAGGGVPIQENEIVEENGGKVFFTSTDQKGDFRIGSELYIDRADGRIKGRTFDKSLFAILTPYILAIEGQ